MGFPRGHIEQCAVAIPFKEAIQPLHQAILAASSLAVMCSM